MLLLFGLVAGCSGFDQFSIFDFQKDELGSATDRPNIILILTDDQDAASLAYMPKLQRYLIDEGVQLLNFFVNVPLCCPSRVSILLGQYAHNTQILTNVSPLGGYRRFKQLGLEEQTFVVPLQASGYRTALIGKFLNGYPLRNDKTYIPPGWTEWFSPVKGARSEGFNYTLNENGRLVSYDDQPQDYKTDVLSDLAKDFIRQSATGGEPFFLFLATEAPHLPAVPAPRHAALFRDLTVPKTPSFMEVDVSEKPKYIRKLRRFSMKTEILNKLYRDYIQSLQAVDDMIENLIHILQETGQLENTYIFFTSDNGFHFGQHRLQPGKRTPYEEDIRVPFIVRGPGLAGGVNRTAISGNIDLAPTIAELAGIELPGEPDGRSLLPVLLSSETPGNWRKAYLLEHWKSKNGVEQTIITPGYRGLRTKSYLYVEYDTGDVELYDLKMDPYQVDNLYRQADKQLIGQLSDWLAMLSVCQGKTCAEVDRRIPPSP